MPLSAEAYVSTTMFSLLVDSAGRLLSTSPFQTLSYMLRRTAPNYTLLGAFRPQRLIY